MKLHFLGQTYQLYQPQIKTLPSEKQAIFRGKNYTLRRYVTMPKPQVILGSRKYRGVTY